MGRRAFRITAIAACIPAVVAGQTTSHGITTATPGAAASAPMSLGVLPTSVAVGGQIRARAESYQGGGFKGGNDDAYVLTRILLSGKVRPTSNIVLFIEGMDARGVWKNTAPAGAPFRDHADLRQLYFQLGADNTPNTIRAGRQELMFGDGRLVGPLLWANTARTFDGLHGSIGRAGYRLDAFATSVVRIDQDRFDKNLPGNNFYGAYGSVSRLVPKSSIEPFLFWRRQSGLKTEAGLPGTLNFGTLGLRATGKQLANFDYDAQVAGQHGKLGDESIAAWAGHALIGYTIAAAQFTPRLFAEYNEASGDKHPTDNRKNTFDQLYPTGHDKYGLTDLVGWQNMKHVRGGLDVAISKTWSATTRYSSYWLEDAHDALYSGGGAVLARSATGAAGTSVGREIDFITNAKVRRGLGVSAGVGHFVPGTFLKTTTPGHAYTYPYAMITYDF